MKDYIVGSYSTFTTSFHATMIQTDAMILSDIFDVSVDFIWTAKELPKGNAAFLKMKFFLEQILHHSILTHPAAPMELDFVDNHQVLLPFVPTNDVLAIVLHAKLNAIADGNIEVISVKVGSKFSEPNISYTHADDSYDMLPSIVEFIGEGLHFHDAPWWHRSTTDCYDFLAEDQAELDEEFDTDGVFEEIDKIVSGELTSPKNGEVIEIPKWNPKIVDD